MIPPIDDLVVRHIADERAFDWPMQFIRAGKAVCMKLETGRVMLAFLCQHEVALVILPQFRL
jgi:hypothetical protein